MSQEWASDGGGSEILKIINNDQLGFVSPTRDAVVNHGPWPFPPATQDNRTNESDLMYEDEKSVEGTIDPAEISLQVDMIEIDLDEDVEDAY